MKRALFVLLCLGLGAWFVYRISGSSRSDQPRPDILLITVDTQRVDRLGMYGYAEGTSPHLDLFSEEAVLFERHYAQAPMTVPSHASIMTGLNPFHHGVHDNGSFQLGAEALTLAEVLQYEGYRTSAMISAGVLHADFGLGQGFDHYDWGLEKGINRVHLVAEHTTERAIEWLEAQDGAAPFFLWLHYFDPHGPYEAPARFDEFGAYDAEVAYADEQLGVLFAYLKQAQLYDEALILLTSDHGQNLWEHKYSGHTLSLYEETLHVPLLIRFPGGRFHGQRVQALTRSIDLMPTLLGYLGLELPSFVDGVDLMPGIEEPAQLPELTAYGETHFTHVDALHKRSLISGRWKLITKYKLEPETEMAALVEEAQRQQREAGEVKQEFEKVTRFETQVRELYDLEADPREEHNLYWSEPERAEAMEALLADLLREARPDSVSEAYTPDEEMRSNLDALGY